MPGALARMIPLGGFDFEISSTDPPVEQCEFAGTKNFPGNLAKVHQ
jgi:hypothetical protein